MNNGEFLKVISNSFREFINSGTSRSTQKLKPLHGAIAQDISERLGEDFSVSPQGFGTDKEGIIQGRYIDKRVDITIEQNGKAVAGIGVKFVMQNYSQNSNNYFENMLGETANIRTNRCDYFQVFIILDTLPHYKRDGSIQKWESFTAHNISKYLTLSKDDVDVYFHTPNKTLIYVVHIPDNKELKTAEEYRQYYQANVSGVELSSQDYGEFSGAVIINDYEAFMSKVYHSIMAK